MSQRCMTLVCDFVGFFLYGTMENFAFVAFNSGSFRATKSRDSFSKFLLFVIDWIQESAPFCFSGFMEFLGCLDVLLL